MTCFKSYSKKALNTAMASVLITAINIVEPTNTLITAATMITNAPANSHLLMPLKSRLITLAKVAITTITPAVPAKAVMTSDAPLLKPSTAANMRDSINPIKKVKPSNTGTPKAEFLVFSIA